jgi:DNA polymerase III epsilon subunit-like protein
MKTVVFDTETTDLPKHPLSKEGVQPRIIEFGAALLDEAGEVIETLQLLINPHQPLEAIITKITGLTDDDLADKPEFHEVLPEITALFAKADIVVAHNLPFDSTLLELELARCGAKDFPWPRIKICTVQERAESWGRRPKLLELYQELTGEPLAQTHRALDDVLALCTIVKKESIIENCHAAIAGSL